RKGARRHRPIGAAARTVFRSSSAGLPLGDRSVRGRNVKLACSEAAASHAKNVIHGTSLGHTDAIFIDVRRAEFQLEELAVHRNFTRTLVVIAVAFGIVAGSSRALAHHGANLYDMTKTVMLKGTVTKFYWGNPHNEVAVDVTDEKGNVAH